MCGSGTFVLEAAEIAAGLAPGRARVFAFEKLASFDPAAWAALRAAAATPRETPLRFHGRDRDAGAIAMSRANAERAGIRALTEFLEAPVSALSPPPGPGLVMVNPPYGTRLGDPRRLAPLHAALGTALRTRFAGWRVGLITPEPALAAATGLPFTAGPPIPHGGLKIRLYRTGPLPPA